MDHWDPRKDVAARSPRLLVSDLERTVRTLASQLSPQSDLIKLLFQLTFKFHSSRRPLFIAIFVHLHDDFRDEIDINKVYEEEEVAIAIWEIVFLSKAWV